MKLNDITDNEGARHRKMRIGRGMHGSHDERLLLARFFNIDERELGAREPWSPA